LVAVRDADKGLKSELFTLVIFVFYSTLQYGLSTAA